jgi:leader peptidase (prepilin peptidase) / N-methyltransferase
VTELYAIVAALAGAAFGFAADRLSVRWPEHEEDYRTRGLDWRTVVVTLTGAGMAAALFVRWQDPLDVTLLLVFGAALVVLLATDLDQRMLPNLITLPLIAYAAVLLVLNLSPLLADRELALISGLAAGIGTPLFLLLVDRLGGYQLGHGDVRLAVAIGLLAGVTRVFTGMLAATVAFAVILLVLMALRRLGRRSLVPFGPVLIGAAFVAMLIE